MPSNQDPNEQEPIDPKNPSVDVDRELDDDLGDDEEREYGVSHKPNPVPSREEEEEELAEADIMEKLDLDDMKEGEGPDA
jgi:hypothetical protein